MVGGATYTMLGEEDTSSFSCIDKCTYAKEGEANSKYCFGAGDLPAECKDSTPSNGGGTAGTTAAGGAGKQSSVVATLHNFFLHSTSQDFSQTLS